MPRSTRVIALAGVAVLAIALGAAALRGTGGDTPADDPTTQAFDGGAEASDTPAPTREPTTDPSASDTPSPDDTSTPTADATDGDGDGDGDAVTGEDTTTDGTAGATGDGMSDGGVADGETVAMGSGGAGAVQDTPRTGGGTVALLGGAVAAGAIVVGRRPRR